MLSFKSFVQWHPKWNTVVFSLIAVLIVSLTNTLNKDLQFATFSNNPKATFQRVANICNTSFQYENEVDFRIIVLAYNRPKSLKKCLNHLQNIQLDGATTHLDIWVDRNAQGEVDQQTLEVAQGCHWKPGMSQVHIQETHAGVEGQWIDTWCPQQQTKEIALILEDDTDVSPFAYRWLKAARNHFYWRKNIAGYSLQDYHTQIGYKDGPDQFLLSPKDSPVYLWRRHGNWGFAPHPEQWHKFQTWYHERKQNKSLHPFVPRDIFTMASWNSNIKRNLTGRIWSYWFIHFTDRNNLWTVSSNLRTFISYTQGRHNLNASLTCNRREPGMNHGVDKIVSSEGKLITHWDNSFVKWPKQIKMFDYDGRRVIPLAHAVEPGLLDAINIL